MKQIKSICFLLLLFTCHLYAQTSKGEYLSTNDIQQQYEGKRFVVFPEIREKPIQWFDSLRVEWLQHDRQEKTFSLNARPGEYFTYQLAVWAIDQLNDVKVKFTPLKCSSGNLIKPGNMTCFNLGGINFRGEPFTKQLQVTPGRIQSLWIGIDLESIPVGTYEGIVTVSSDRYAQSIPISLSVEGNQIENHGYNEGKRMSRMNWLNNTIALDDELTKPFTALKRTDHAIDMLGRRFYIGKDGLPASVVSYFTSSVQSIGTKGEEILQSPFRFVIEKESGEEIRLTPGNIHFKQESAARIVWDVKNTSPEIEMLCTGTIEYEGFVDYKVTLKAQKLLNIKDIRLEVPVTKEKSEYMMGLHYEGGLRPRDTYAWTWDTTRNQDMLWIGNVNGGLRMKWKAENYVRPLINIYYNFGPLHLPSSWGNDGKGGVKVQEQELAVIVNAYSGQRKMKKGETLHYDFELLITPFRTINKEVQFGDRYFHGGGNDESTKVAQAKKGGANIINIHHAGDLYPFINYPYLDENTDDLKRIIADAHRHNMLMKFYYTTRELTKNTPEFWAFYSLNGEIIYPGPGNESRTSYLHPNGPAEWLKVNIREKYIPAWYNEIDRGRFKGELDLSVITNPDSRLNNFYIGGLDWMVKNMDLDGVYIDDSALDRITLRRARKVIDRNRPNGKMDLHSCNHYDPCFGYASCLNMYMELLPYFDLCWIGEGRNYDRMPDHWLIEVAGIPFGLPGQMLQNHGNPWRGMVYGITNRLGFSGDPTAIWRFWDTYRIQEMEMIGYWDKENPITVDNEMVKATLYKGCTVSIISIAGWSKADQVCNVEIDWKKLGYNPSDYTYYLPAIKDFQKEQELKTLSHLTIPEGKGFLIVLKNK